MQESSLCLRFMIALAHEDRNDMCEIYFYIYLVGSKSSKSIKVYEGREVRSISALCLLLPSREVN